MLTVCLVAIGVVRADRIQQQKLIAADGAAWDCFGCSVSNTADYYLIGAAWDDANEINSGSAYIFNRSTLPTDPNWYQQAKLTASDAEQGDEFGRSVSIHGDYCLVGALYGDGNEPDSGSAYVFKRDAANWTEDAELIAPDGKTGDYFGDSVSISGDYAAIGASLDDHNGTDSGSAYIFKRTGATWTQQAKLAPSDAGPEDHFGNCVCLSGDYLIVGSYKDDDNGMESGSAYVFKRDATIWSQEAKLLPDDGAVGDRFGSSVSIHGDYAVIGAPYDDDNGLSTGSAYVFARSGSIWTQITKLTAPDGAAGHYFGYSVSIGDDEGTILIGARGDDDAGPESGSAYIFKRDIAGPNWHLYAKLTASDGQSLDWFGTSVSLSNGKAIVGAAFGDGRVADSGAAYAHRICPVADLSGNCFVDFVDYSIFVDYWVRGSLEADLNWDLFLDFADVGVFVHYWLQGN